MKINSTAEAFNHREEFKEGIVNYRQDSQARLAPDMGLVNADQAAPPIFDKDFLPGEWSEWCAETAEALGCPVDYVAANLLTSASAWIGNSYRTAATHDWSEPPHIWVALVGAPSTGKTPSQKPFIDASRNIELEKEPNWLELSNDHESVSLVARKKRENWEQDVSDAIKDGRATPPMPLDATAPDAPSRPRLLVCESTQQELANILRGNPKGLLLVRDELSGWIGGFDRYGGNGADRAFYLESWNGGSHTVDAVKNNGKPTSVPYVSLSILGGIQPDKLNEALTGADDGFAARFIIVWPDPSPFSYLRTEAESVANLRKKRLSDAASKLSGLEMTADENGRKIPKIIKLSTQARALFEEIRRDASTKSQNTRGLLSGWHGKTPARALRIALIIEFLNWANKEDINPPEDISGDSMACAGGYIDYAEKMFERAIAGIAIDEAEADAALIARHILKHKPETINERELYQTSGFNHLRLKARRDPAFRALSEARWIHKAEYDQAKGRKPNDWTVNKQVFENNGAGGMQ